MIQVLHVGSSSNETNSWSMFGFLYGTFPAAPSSAIFAAKFGFEEELVIKCYLCHKWQIFPNWCFISYINFLSKELFQSAFQSVVFTIITCEIQVGRVYKII